MIKLGLLFATALFCIGMIGVLTRRNSIVVFMGIELMLNAANLALVTFSRLHQNIGGHVFVFMSITVAAAEAAVGLAIVIVLYRHIQSIHLNDAKRLLG